MCFIYIRHLNSVGPPLLWTSQPTFRKVYYLVIFNKASCILFKRFVEYYYVSSIFVMFYNKTHIVKMIRGFVARFIIVFV